MAEQTERQQKILVSACLCGGRPYRYDGTDKPCLDPRFRRWLEEGILIPVCPEVQGGLPVPRPPAPALLHEEDGGLWRRRADLVIRLRVTDICTRENRRPGIAGPPVVILK